MVLTSSTSWLLLSAPIRPFRESSQRVLATWTDLILAFLQLSQDCRILVPAVDGVILPAGELEDEVAVLVSEGMVEKI